MKQQKGMRVIAFVLASCLVFHSGTIYAAKGAATTELKTIAEPLAETQVDTTTPDQDSSTSNTSTGTNVQEQAQSDAPAVTETQEQTAESDSTGTETQEQTQSDTLAVTETQEQTAESDPTGTETQGQIQSDTLTEKEEQGQTEESDPTDTDANAETSAAADGDPSQSEAPTAEETLPEGTDGSDETVSGTAGNETDETTAEGTIEESTEIEETDTEQETTTGETMSMTEPLSENAETESETESESETDGIAMMMGLDEIALEGAVAKDGGGNRYESLQKAIDKANGGTITLLDDVSGSFTSNGKSFTLDLGGHTLTASGGTALTVADGEVTVKSGTINGDGSARVLELKGGCKFTGTELTVCNGQVNENGGGISATESCTVNLTDCHILSNTVDGSYNKGGGIYMKGGTLTISSTEIAKNIAYYGSGLYLESVNVDGEALDIHGNTYNGNGSISGVYLKSVSGSIKKSEVYENTMSHSSGVCISGGSFELDGVNIWENTVYNSANDGGVALSCESGAKLTYSNGKIYGNNGQIYDDNGKRPGPGAIVSTKNNNAAVQFENADIFGNTDVKYTVWIRSSTTASFDQCNISGNTASEVGGVEVIGLNAIASFQNTVIKNNTADSVIGGLYVGTNAGVDFKSSIAIYGNTTKAQNSENDILIESNKPEINLPAANSMQDGDKSFVNYVWKEGNEKYSKAVQIPASNTKKRSFTAIEDKKRYVAQIGETKYEKLEDAVEQAAEGNTIVLIAGEDPEDPFGKSLVSDKTITISKSVTIHFDGQDISCTEESVGNKLFEVTESGSLTLTGVGKISGEVESQGTLTLQGKVSAEKYIHSGTKFTLDGSVGDITVALAEGKYLTATDNCNADSIILILDSDFVSKFNDETVNETADRVLVEHGGNFNESKLVLQGIKPLISELINIDNTVKLHKSLLEGVYVGGTGAKDWNSGTSTEQPVATLEHAIELLKKNKDLDTIWVLGEVTVADTEEIDADGKAIQRHPSYSGVLIHLKNGGVLNLNDVEVNGMRKYMEGPTKSLIVGESGSSISIGAGAVLKENDIIGGDVSIDLSKSEDFRGGAISSSGSVYLDGGTISGCSAFMGGGISMKDSGQFYMKAGTIQNCSVSGSIESSGSSTSRAAGGGVCISGNAQMTMSGGSIEYCKAIKGIGAGISLGGSFIFGTDYNMSGEDSFTMNGGQIIGCEADSNGGGMYIQASYRASINAGRISGNYSNSGNFGGGGVYVNSNNKNSDYDNGLLQLYNAVIRGNNAEGEGGGLAGCNTSNTHIYLNDGGVFYGNTSAAGKDDILLSNSDGVVEVDNPNSFVSEYMLGGAPYLWKHVGSGLDYGVNYLHDENRVKHMYAGAEKAAEKAAESPQAKVFIENNHAKIRGGGIGSNGDVILGTAPIKDATVDILVKKVWEDGDYGVPRPAQVAVWLLRNKEKVGCVEIDSDNNIDNEWPEVSFTLQPKWDSAGTEYEYTIFEEVERAGQSAAGRNIYTSTVDPADANEKEYTVTNRINCGRLYIKKTANGVPTDLEEKFKIKVEFTDNKGNAVPGPYTVRRGNASENETSAEFAFVDGTDIITLMAGQYAYIDDIPGNTNYKVTEPDAEGYIVYTGTTENPGTEQPSLSGKIEAKQTKSAYFKNVYSHDSKITVTKLVTDDKGNEYPLTRSFWVALFEDEDLTVRATEPQELVFDGTSSVSVTFEGLLNNKTYYVGELDRNGSVINDKTNYFSDGSAFTVQFGDGGNAVTAVHGTTPEISFRNEVTPKTEKRYQSIPIIKTLTGRTANAGKDIYTFTLTGIDGAPMPAKNSATLTLSAATAVSTFADMFGEIPFEKAGTYTYELREAKGSIGGIAYDETVYRITIKVESFDTVDNTKVLISNVTALEKSNNGKGFEPVQGGVDGTAAFANTYAAEPVTFEASVSKTVTGDVPLDDQKTFTFMVEPKGVYTGVTMPEDRTCTVTGSGSGAFGAITFAKPGTYAFTIKETKGTDSGYTYDDTEYTLTLVVEDNLDGKLVITNKTYQAGEEQRTDAAEFVNRYQTGSLVVTKSLTYGGHPLHALKATFYVALYADKECRQRVSDVKALVYEDTISAEVVFDGLEIGVPYYVGECDKEGTAFDSGVLLDGTFFRTVFANGSEILLSADKEQVRKDFSNEFVHIPTDYYYQGELTVTKHLQDAEGNPKNSNDIFYLGIFEDEAHTKLSGAVEPNILTLDMAGHSSATAKVYTRTPDEAGLKLYIAEVDANGVVIQDKEDFGYDLTMSSDAPMLTMDQSSVAVSVTNREKVEKGATEETEEYTEIESQTGEGQSEIPESAKAAKTGDETKLWRYLILLVLSAGAIAAMLGKMRKGRGRN